MYLFDRYKRDVNLNNVAVGSWTVKRYDVQLTGH